MKGPEEILIRIIAPDAFEVDAPTPHRPGWAFWRKDAQKSDATVMSDELALTYALGLRHGMEARDAESNPDR